MALPTVYGNTRRPTPVMGLQPFQGGATAAAPAPMNAAAPAAPGVPSLTAPQGGLMGILQQHTGGQIGGPSYGQFIKQLLQQGGQSGAFGPNYLRDLLRRRAVGTYANQGRRSQALAGLFGLDPMQQRQAMVANDQSASAGLSGALNEADLSGAQGYQQMLMQMLGGERGREYEAQQAAAARKAQGGGFGGFLGQIAGSLIPGVGGLIGGGGRQPAAPQRTTPPDRWG